MRSCLIFLLLVYSVAHAQQQEPDIVRTNTELVQTAITVLDKKGHFVEGLQREQFQLMVDGKPRPVAFFERVAAGSPRESEIANLGNTNTNAATTTTAPR